jgi:hypothetical protein
MILRKQGDVSLLIRFVKAEKEVQLVLKDSGSEDILEKEHYESEFFGSSSICTVVASKNTILVYPTVDEEISFKHRKIPTMPGTFGFSANNVRVGLHQLSISSVVEEE